VHLHALLGVAAELVGGYHLPDGPAGDGYGLVVDVLHARVGDALLQGLEGRKVRVALAVLVERGRGGGVRHLDPLSLGGSGRGGEGFAEFAIASGGKVDGDRADVHGPPEITDEQAVRQLVVIALFEARLVAEGGEPEALEAQVELV